MSKKCMAYSESKLGLLPPDSRKAFYAGWDAALRALRAALAEHTPNGDAEPQWLLLTPELLTAIESGDHGTRFWIVSKWSSEPEIGEYEWRQGRGPHGFNTHDSRLGADEVTHVMHYRAPKMPAAEIGKGTP